MEKIKPIASDAVCLPHPMAERIAGANCSILLTGETGTGKGYLAKWIHEHSSRHGGAFVPVNCGAIPENLIDSHLFGHVKGSFSGASADHLGLVRAASGGTILFDEISELPLTAQTRLLRLMEEREVQPVGYSKPIVVDVRVIAATNVDLPSAVRKGAFREDLYFRLDVVRIAMTPLRDRASEIEQFIHLFNDEFAALYRQPTLAFDCGAIEFFKRHAWPGNVRELRTVIERLHVLRANSALPISMNDLRLYGQMSTDLAQPMPAHTPLLQQIKGRAVSEVLDACRGNVSRAAVELGVHRSTIYRWLANAPVAA